MDGWPLCSTEVDASFARLAGSDETSDPDLIEEIDVISWYNTVLEFGDREYIGIAARDHYHKVSGNGNILALLCAVAQHSVKTHFFQETVKQIDVKSGAKMPMHNVSRQFIFVIKF